MPELPARVVLVGFMGSGKSTVGPLVAERLGYEFEDLDRRIETRAGATIAALFAERGEEAFRVLEREEARAVAGLPRRVVAAGGGAFARAETRALLREGALVVWLRADAETLFGRIPGDGARPLAANHDIMRALLAEREPSYSLADVTIDTAGHTPAEVAETVVEHIERGRTTAR